MLTHPPLPNSYLDGYGRMRNGPYYDAVAAYRAGKRGTKYGLLASAPWSYQYAMEVVKGRFIDGEPAMVDTHSQEFYALAYALNCLRSRFLLYEQKLASVAVSRESLHRSYALILARNFPDDYDQYVLEHGDWKP